jgi:hypothetical protein
MNQQSTYCDWCGTEFEQSHGNERYCSEEHKNLAKKFRQGERYGGISPLLPILHHNHDVLEKLFYRKQDSFAAIELESESLDFSLFRRLYPDMNNNEMIRLDFGTYYLETDDNYQTFKLYKYETKSR